MEEGEEGISEGGGKRMFREDEGRVERGESGGKEQCKRFRVT